MVSAWKEKEFGWIEDKGEIWVSKGLGINNGYMEEVVVVCVFYLGLLCVSVFFGP